MKEQKNRLHSLCAACSNTNNDLLFGNYQFPRNLLLIIFKHQQVAALSQIAQIEIPG